MRHWEIATEHNSSISRSIVECIWLRKKCFVDDSSDKDHEVWAKKGRRQEARVEDFGATEIDGATAAAGFDTIRPSKFEN